MRHKDVRVMRLVAVSLVLVGCAGTQRPSVGPPASAFGEAAVKARSHAFYDAIDRFDIAELTAAVAPSFVLLSNARTRELGYLQKEAQVRLDQHARPYTRTWIDERVYVGPTSAVFVGHAIQRIPTDDGNTERDGYDTLVWVPSDGTWKIAFAEWARGGPDADKEDWNDVYRVSNSFKKAPNQLLIEAVEHEKPGTALDIAMGQGRNALYLAERGWRVTGIDFAEEPLRLAREAAARRKLTLDAIQGDIEHWDYGVERWDLVAMIYAGDDVPIVERLQRSIKRGGLFVLEFFADDGEPTRLTAGGWPRGALARLFAGNWDVLRDDVVEDIADWGLKKAKLQRFVARKK
jgi:SAM-dependent methyltransferase